MDAPADNAPVKPFAQLRTRAGQLALLFINLWWAVEISLFETHQRISHLAFIEAWGGSELIFDAILWTTVAFTAWAFYRPTRRAMLAMAFVNLSWWTFVGIQFWLVTQTKLVSGLCFGLAVALLARIAEVAGEDG